MGDTYSENRDEKKDRITVEELEGWPLLAFSVKLREASLGLGRVSMFCGMMSNIIATHARTNSTAADTET